MNFYNYKNDCLSSGFYRVGNYWDLSYEVLNCIEDNSYVDNKQLFNEYLKDNPFVAQKKFINIAFISFFYFNGNIFILLFNNICKNFLINYVYYVNSI